jgi:hypothetical protein
MVALHPNGKRTLDVIWRRRAPTIRLIQRLLEEHVKAEAAENSPIT